MYKLRIYSNLRKAQSDNPGGAEIDFEDMEELTETLGKLAVKGAACLVYTEDTLGFYDDEDEEEY